MDLTVSEPSLPSQLVCVRSFVMRLKVKCGILLAIIGMTVVCVSTVELMTAHVGRAEAHVVALRTIPQDRSTAARCAVRVSFVPRGNAEPTEASMTTAGACGAPCSPPTPCLPSTLHICYALRKPTDVGNMQAVDCSQLGRSCRMETVDCPQAGRTGTIVAIAINIALTVCGVILMAWPAAQMSAVTTTTKPGAPSYAKLIDIPRVSAVVPPPTHMQHINISSVCPSHRAEP